MNETEPPAPEQNIIQIFLDKYPDLRQNKLAKALDLSRDQIYRLKKGQCEIMNYIKKDLWNLDRFLKYGGEIEDFRQPEYGEDDETELLLK